jgi:hypothetical protein
MKSTSLFALIAAVALSAPVFAQNSANVGTPKIDQRQEHQQDRIAAGVKSGQLTARETQQLEQREAKIETDKRLAKADGTVTKAERAKLNKELTHASHKIYKKKHNRQKATA